MAVKKVEQDLWIAARPSEGHPGHWLAVRLLQIRGLLVDPKQHRKSGTGKAAPEKRHRKSGTGKAAPETPDEVTTAPSRPDDTRNG